MAFYAKGGTNAFLHITKGTGARGGINDGTIFHSSMPHVFIEKSWEANFRPVKTDFSKAYWNYAIWYYGNQPGEGFNKPNSTFKDAWNSGRVASIPKDLQNELANKSNVIVIELVYELGGIEYSFLVNGLSIGNTSWLSPNRDQSSGYHNYAVSANSTNVNCIAGGIGITYGSFVNTNTSDDIFGMARLDSFGTSNINIVTQVRDSYLTGSDKWYHRDIINAWSTVMLYSNKWDPEITYHKTDLGKLVPTPISPYGHAHDTAFSTPVAPDMGYCRVMGPNHRIWRFMDAYSTPPMYDDYDNGGPSITIESGTPQNNWGFGTGRTVRGSLFDAGVDEKTSEKGAYVRYLIYKGTPKKVRWYKLNLSFSIDRGYNIRTNAFNTTNSKGVRIGSGKMEVNGVSFLGGSNKRFIFQTNPSGAATRQVQSLIFSNHSYTDAGRASTEKGYMLKQSGVSQSYKVADLGGTSSPSGNSVLSICDLSKGTGWGCNSTSIFNSNGELWGPNNIPLTIRENATVTKRFGGSKGPLDMKDKTATISHGTLALGLSKSRDTTVIFNITSSDPVILFTSPGYYSLGMSESVDQHIQLVNDKGLSVSSPHGIVTLPIGKSVPIVANNGLSTNLFENYDRRSGRERLFSDCHHDSVVWLKNLGNGNVEIVSTHTQRRGRFADWGNLPVYAVPEFTLHVTKLS